MEYQHEEEEGPVAAAVAGISTIVTNSPTSFSTDGRTTVSAPTVPITETTTTSIIPHIMTDSNVDTFNATGHRVGRSSNSSTSNSSSDCPIRASGRVCICHKCETIRCQLLRNCHHNGPPSSVKDPSLLERDSTLMTRNKRSLDEYKFDDDDDDDVAASGLVPPSTTAVRHKERASTVALTEVVTTTATAATLDAAVVTHTNNTSNDTNHDAEQQKLQIMSNACRTILQCIGEDPNREGLQKTPERWAKALLFLCHGYHLTPSQVTNNAVFTENHNEMVVVRNIDIHSLCEHHMVPFTGHVHIGYIPNGAIIGLSKLARLADLFARRLQVQERLTRQIATAIQEILQPLGVAVVMECTHYCMVMRGVQKTGTMTTTSSVRGCFETNSKTRAEFFSILHGGCQR